jgi:hypothetical protein
MWVEPTAALPMTTPLLPHSSRNFDEEVGHVAINQPYTLRVALAAENHPLAMGPPSSPIMIVNSQRELR